MSEDPVEEHISVSIRVRPLSKKEKKKKEQNVWNILEDNSIHPAVDSQPAAIQSFGTFTQPLKF